MKPTPINKGKIADHFSGLGTVTREMVEKRARELAIINGREANQVNEADWQQAKRELQGVINEPDTAGDETVNALSRWDEAPGDTGRKVPPEMPADDEQTFAEQLVEQGVEEANHEQMLVGSREPSDQKGS